MTPIRAKLLDDSSHEEDVVIHQWMWAATQPRSEFVEPSVRAWALVEDVRGRLYEVPTERLRIVRQEIAVHGDGFAYRSDGKGRNT